MSKCTANKRFLQIINAICLQEANYRCNTDQFSLLFLLRFSANFAKFFGLYIRALVITHIILKKFKIMARLSRTTIKD